MLKHKIYLNAKLKTQAQVFKVSTGKCICIFAFLHFEVVFGANGKLRKRCAAVVGSSGKLCAAGSGVVLSIVVQFHLPMPTAVAAAADHPAKLQQ